MYLLIFTSFYQTYMIKYCHFKFYIYNIAIKFVCLQFIFNMLHITYMYVYKLLNFKGIQIAIKKIWIKSIDFIFFLIQNPAPGLQVFQAPAPYAEVDPDFHLCPLPRYIRKDYATNQHAATQRKYLDREVGLPLQCYNEKVPRQ